MKLKKLDFFPLKLFWSKINSNSPDIRDCMKLWNTDWLDWFYLYKIFFWQNKLFNFTYPTKEIGGFIVLKLFWSKLIVISLISVIVWSYGILNYQTDFIYNKFYFDKINYSILFIKVKKLGFISLKIILIKNYPRFPDISKYKKLWNSEWSGWCY